MKRTPLHIANQKNNLALASTLLKNGADVDKTDDDGQTELHYAVRFGRRDMTKLLIDNKATINIMDKDGDIPLEIASQRSMLLLFEAKKKLIKN